MTTKQEALTKVQSATESIKAAIAPLADEINTNNFRLIRQWSQEVANTNSQLKAKVFALQSLQSWGERQIEYLTNESPTSDYALSVISGIDPLRVTNWFLAEVSNKVL